MEDILRFKINAHLISMQGVRNYKNTITTSNKGSKKTKSCRELTALLAANCRKTLNGNIVFADDGRVRLLAAVECCAVCGSWCAVVHGSGVRRGFRVFWPWTSALLWELFLFLDSALFGNGQQTNQGRNRFENLPQRSMAWRRLGWPISCQPVSRANVALSFFHISLPICAARSFDNKTVIATMLVAYCLMTSLTELIVLDFRYTHMHLFLHNLHNRVL